MVFTDPPYNVPIDGHVSGLGDVRHREFAMASGEMSEAEFTGFLEDMLRASGRGTASTGRFTSFAWIGGTCFELLSAGAADIHRAQEPVRMEQEQWRHGLALSVQARTGLRLQERRRAAHKQHRAGPPRPQPHQRLGLRRASTRLRDGRLEELAMHPTVKPVALVADAILDCSKRGGIVLDCFGGSGTTLIAAEKTGRRGSVMELDAAYVDVRIRRFEKLTGERADTCRDRNGPSLTSSGSAADEKICADGDEAGGRRRRNVK